MSKEIVEVIKLLRRLEYLRAWKDTFKKERNAPGVGFTEDLISTVRSSLVPRLARLDFQLQAGFFFTRAEIEKMSKNVNFFSGLLGELENLVLARPEASHKSEKT